jgi:hypothetical protein
MMIASRRQICMGVTLTELEPFMTTNLWSPGMTELPLSRNRSCLTTD